jgi:putative transposase
MVFRDEVAARRGERTVGEAHRAYPWRVARHLRLAAGARRTDLGLGLVVNHKRVARLMRQAGIQGLYRRRRRGCTVRDRLAEPYVDLVDRDFVVDGPDELWCVDITEHATGEGKLYCAAAIDAYSRRIVGWSIAAHMRTELVVDALGMAITRRQPEPYSAILHSDHGCQFQCH